MNRLSVLYRSRIRPRLTRNRRVREVQRVSSLTFDQLREHQLRRLRIVCAAAANADYYRRAFSQAGLADASRITWEQFRRLPLLTKDILRRQVDELIPRGCQKGDLRPSATGGTTTTPTTIYMDWESLAWRQAAGLFFDGWTGFRPSGRLAFLWGAPQDMPRTDSIAGRLKAFLTRSRLFLPAMVELDDQRLEQYYQALRRFRPQLLQSYPSALSIFAGFLLRTGKRLDIPALTCTAEVLTPSQRAVIERAFGVRVFDWYGARELGRIATECHLHDGLHVNAFGLFVENAECAGERTARLIVTDLWNVGMPLIRYEIEDMGAVVESPCRCGCALPRIAQVQGRAADLLFSPRGLMIPGVIAEEVMGDESEFSAVQIVQHGLGDIEVLVIEGPRHQRESDAKLRDHVDQALGGGNRVRVTRVERIPREPSGKLRYCKNAMKREVIEHWVNHQADARRSAG